MTPRILTKQLRDLEADGLITRTVSAAVPPRGDYDLTEKGESRTPILNSLKDWGEIHAVPTVAARQTEAAKAS